MNVAITVAAAIVVMSATSGSTAVAATNGIAQGPVKLKPTPRRSLATLPEVLSSSAVPRPIAVRINAALRRKDARASQAAAQCRRSFREMQKRPSAYAWTRDITVTMAGPTYLAYQVSDSYYCGGAYPNDGMRSTFVYDLATGRPVDWLALFPAGASGKNEMSVSGATLGLVAWPELSRRMADDATGECREAISDMSGQERANGFAIGLDARSGELVAQPAEFPHVIQACAEDVRLGTQELRRLGFSPTLVGALQSAKRQQRPKR